MFLIESAVISLFTIPLLVYGALAYRSARVSTHRRAFIVFAIASPLLWMACVYATQFLVDWSIQRGWLHSDYGLLGIGAGWMYGSRALAILGAIALTAITASWRVGVAAWIAALLIWFATPRAILPLVSRAEHLGYIPLAHLGYWTAGISAVMWHAVVAFGMFTWARSLRKRDRANTSPPLSSPDPSGAPGSR